MSTNQKFIIFSPTGEVPHTTLAVIQGKPDEKGQAECQAIIDGKNSELLASFSAIVDGLLNHCHIPFPMLLSAFMIGCKAMDKCSTVIDKEFEEVEDDERDDD